MKLARQQRLGGGEALDHAIAQFYFFERANRVGDDEQGGRENRRERQGIAERRQRREALTEHLGEGGRPRGSRIQLPCTDAGLLRRPHSTAPPKSEKQKTTTP